MTKRDFLKGLILFIPGGGVVAATARQLEAAAGPNGANGKAYDPREHTYGMGIEIDRCIGCNRCVEACKAENGVPKEPFFFRTWVERYAIRREGEVTVDSISIEGGAGRDRLQDPRDVLRTFFVPKLCNQCARPPCVQVCPVGATFGTADGVVLVDGERCIGCRYCIQACPYGARYLHPERRVADKCTFCYHRLARGLMPACVEICPTQARIFGDLRSKASRLVRFQRLNRIHVLKPALNTEPRVYYAGLDGEVR
jgi:Fe-S-cluster-containing dehydrogenase component